MAQRSQNPRVSRRLLLKSGVGLIGGGLLCAGSAKGAVAQESPPSSISTESQNQTIPAKLTPKQALNQLMQGNQQFVSQKRLNPHQNTIRLGEVALEQAPFAAILGCADSRVVPEIIFDQGIGDLFTVRVAGNIAITEDIASEEYAVVELGVPLLMVLGHEGCGAVTAALKGGSYAGVIPSLVTAIAPAIAASSTEPGDRLTNAIKANIHLQVKRLKNSKVIASAIKQGKLKVVGAYYELATGKVKLLDM